MLTRRHLASLLLASLALGVQGCGCDSSGRSSDGGTSADTPLLWNDPSGVGGSSGGGSAGGGGTTGGGTTPVPPGGGVPPTGLPTRFGLGLSSGPGGADWMNASGASWDYRYQYLSGSATGSNWSQWNQPAGEFAKLYMSESSSNGYVPVLSYYIHAQTLGEANLGGMTNGGSMFAYYSNWKLLMQKAAEYGGTVVIHHEPDLWGYMQNRNGDNPAGTAVAVSSSGFPEAAGLPDNAAGFAQALVKIRDTYARNATVAWHASAWATGTDITFGGDGAALGARVANFFNALGADFDLVFSDFTDRDSGWYAANGQPNRWMDAAAFDRFRAYYAAISSGTRRRIMIWQIPCGNTLYRTCNNTSGHYQSNHAEYFLLAANRQRIVDWSAAGVIGLLFGSTVGGNNATTHYGDAMNDGVTNPPPVNGNDLPAAYSDDDGGFLRTSAQQYYQNPVPLP